MSEVHDFIDSDPRSYGPFGDDLDTVTTEELLGASFVVHGYKLRDSTFDEGKEYVMVDLELDSGEHVMYRTGGMAIQDQLKRNWEANNFPFRASLVEKISNKTKKPYPSFVSVG